MDTLTQIWNIIYNFMDYDFVQSFVSNFLATILGVAAGIPAAFWINRRVETKIEKEKRTRILRLLLFELQDILEFIQDWKEDDKTFKSKRMKIVPSARLMRDDTWRALSDGGELQWIKSPELLRELAYTYDLIAVIKKMSEMLSDSILDMKLLNMISFGRLSRLYSELLKERMVLLEKEVTDTISLIEKTLKMKS